MYITFFTIKDPAIRIVIPKSVQKAKFYKGKVNNISLKKDFANLSNSDAPWFRIVT